MQPLELIYVEMPGAAGEALAFNRALGKQLCFGISLYPVPLADLGAPGSSRHAALRNDVRRLTEDEAVELMTARIAQKAAAAVRAGEERLQLFRASLCRIKDGASGKLIAAPEVQAALAAATAAATAPPPASQPVDTVDTLRAELAGLHARLEQLGQGAPA